MNEMRDVKDSLDSLHQRMDRFYAWASQLQVEMRNAQQRIGFLENQVKEQLQFNKAPNGGGGDQMQLDQPTETEASIMERLNRIRHQ